MIDLFLGCSTSDGAGGGGVNGASVVPITKFSTLKIVILGEALAQNPVSASINFIYVRISF